MRSGRASSKPKDISFYEALKDPDTRAEYIRRRRNLGNFIVTTHEQHCPDLQMLQWWSEAFIVAIVQSTRKMPYSMRCIARETLLSLRVS